MNPTDHRKDVNKRRDDSYEERSKKFKEGVTEIFKNIPINNYDTKTIDEILTKEAVYFFLNPPGNVNIKQSSEPAEPVRKQKPVNSQKTIISCLEEKNCNSEFRLLIEHILNAMSDGIGFRSEYENDKDKISPFIIGCVKNAIEQSKANISLKQGSNNGRIDLLLRGEEILNEELIDKPLSFLDKKSKPYFQKALEFYQKGQPILSANQPFHALENFLRHKLKNKKGIINNMKELKKYLEVAKAPHEIWNIAHEIFAEFYNYLNDEDRHKREDRYISEQENEFLIYQTGSLLRYINDFDFDLTKKIGELKEKTVAEKLNKELSDNPLSFLNKKSYSHFKKALEFCQKRQANESGANLFRALKEFLRHKLNDTEEFEKNIETLRKHLKSAKLPPQIRNIAHKIFERLCKYSDECNKRGNRDISEQENEFLIYQTGLLLRYISSFDFNLTKIEKLKTVKKVK